MENQYGGDRYGEVRLQSGRAMPKLNERRRRPIEDAWTVSRDVGTSCGGISFFFFLNFFHLVSANTAVVGQSARHLPRTGRIARRREIAPKLSTQQQLYYAAVCRWGLVWSKITFYEQFLAEKFFRTGPRTET